MNEAQAKKFVLEHSNIPMDHVKEVVVHYADDYDPAKAREYYLRTRKLKGRKAGSKVAPVGRKPSAAKIAARPRPVAKKSAAQHHKEVFARVEAMKGRLEKLRKLLRELTKQAQARSGVDPKKDKKAKPTAGSKKLTAAERKEAAKRSAEYRKKHEAELKKETLTDQEKRLNEQIKDVEAKIAKAKADLKAAVAKARPKNPAAPSRRTT